MKNKKKNNKDESIKEGEVAEKSFEFDTESSAGSEDENEIDIGKPHSQEATNFTSINMDEQNNDNLNHGKILEDIDNTNNEKSIIKGSKGKAKRVI